MSDPAVASLGDNGAMAIQAGPFVGDLGPVPEAEAGGCLTCWDHGEVLIPHTLQI